MKKYKINKLQFAKFILTLLILIIISTIFIQYTLVCLDVELNNVEQANKKFIEKIEI